MQSYENKSFGRVVRNKISAAFHIFEAVTGEIRAAIQIPLAPKGVLMRDREVLARGKVVKYQGVDVVWDGKN